MFRTNQSSHASYCKTIWRKLINKLLKDTIPIEAPESTKIDVQLKELLGEY